MPIGKSRVLEQDASREELLLALRELEETQLPVDPQPGMSRELGTWIYLWHEGAFRPQLWSEATWSLLTDPKEFFQTGLLLLGWLAVAPEQLTSYSVANRFWPRFFQEASLGESPQIEKLRFLNDVIPLLAVMKNPQERLEHWDVLSWAPHITSELVMACTDELAASVYQAMATGDDDADKELFRMLAQQGTAAEGCDPSGYSL